MTVSMSGLSFQPAESVVFAPGAKARQGLAIMLKRLVGAQYQPGMEDEAALQLNDGVQGLGNMEGSAQGGEPLTQFYVTAELALKVIEWLEAHTPPLAVALTTAQRDLLRYGVFSSLAWADIQNHANEIGETFPPWFTEDLFRIQMGNRTALLRAYIDGLTAYRAVPSPTTIAWLNAVLRQIVESVDNGAQVLDAIRDDDELITHPVYDWLWPMPQPAPTGSAASAPAGGTPAAPPPRQEIAPEDQSPNPGVATAFLNFLSSQSQLAKNAILEHADRATLLDRFARFYIRISVSNGDEKVLDTPGQANAPAIPSRLGSYPALEPPLYDAALETDHTFTMQLQFPDVFEALASYGYDWSRVRVPDEEINGNTDVTQMKGETPTWGEVAGVRFRRTARYARADLERNISSIAASLGQPGLGVGSLLAGNAVLRFLGTGIRLGLEILTTPASEKHVVFPEAGLYLVRCKAVANYGDDAEVVRVPSVAYAFVLARDPDEMAELRTQADVDARDQGQERLVELMEMLAEPVTHINQEALEAELRDLTAALGSVGDSVKNQQRLLTERRDTLPEHSAERAEIEKQLTRLELILEVREKRGKKHGLTGAETVTATFVSDEGQVIRMLLEAVPKTAPQGQASYYVSDLTTPNSDDATETGANREDAILAALRSILEGIHGYGRGRVSVSFGDHLTTIRIEASKGSLLSEAAENLSLILSIAAVAAAPFTGGASLVLLIPAGIIGALPSAYRILSRVENGTFRFDLQMAMDIVNLVAAFAGAGGEAASALKMVRVGQALMFVGVGANGLGMLLMGASIVDQIASLEGLPEGMRLARTMEIIGMAMIQAGIAIGTIMVENARARRAETENATGQGGGEEHAAPRRSLAPSLEEAELVRPPRRTADGQHEIKVTKRGQLAMCSWPCAFFKDRYQTELAANPALEARRAAIDSELDVALARTPPDAVAIDAALDLAVGLERDLHAARAAGAGTPPLASGVTPSQVETLTDAFGREGSRQLGDAQMAPNPDTGATNPKKVGKLANIADNLQTAFTTEGVKPLTAGHEGFIADNNIVSAIRELMGGTKWEDLQPHKRVAINAMRRAQGLPEFPVDLAHIKGYVTPTDYAGLVGKAELILPYAVLGESGAIPGATRHAVDLTVSRNSQPYTDALNALAAPPGANGRPAPRGIGGGAGATDRLIVADALFARTTESMPRLISGDLGVYESLAYFEQSGDVPKGKDPAVPPASYRENRVINGKNQKVEVRVGDYVARTRPDGFIATVNGHKLLVIPAGAPK